jgi:hypothetical protein
MRDRPTLDHDAIRPTPHDPTPASLSVRSGRFVEDRCAVHPWVRRSSGTWRRRGRCTRSGAWRPGQWWLVGCGGASAGPARSRRGRWWLRSHLPGAGRIATPKGFVHPDGVTPGSSPLAPLGSADLRARPTGRQHPGRANPNNRRHRISRRSASPEPDVAAAASVACGPAPATGDTAEWAHQTTHPGRLLILTGPHACHPRPTATGGGSAVGVRGGVGGVRPVAGDPNGLDSRLSRVDVGRAGEPTTLQGRVFSATMSAASSGTGDRCQLDSWLGDRRERYRSRRRCSRCVRAVGRHQE